MEYKKAAVHKFLDLIVKKYPRKTAVIFRDKKMSYSDLNRRANRLANGLIDNLLAPHFLTHGLRVHPFLILLSVLGGLWFFGPVGFLAGPVLVTLLITLLGMYPAIVSGDSIKK